MRFATVNGTIVDVYQAATQMTDESGQSYPFTIDTLLDRALGPQGYYGTFVANMHTDVPVDAPVRTAIVASAQARGVPVISARQLLTWVDGRNASRFGALSWDGNELAFTITAASGARGLQALLPAAAANGALTEIRRDGAPVPFALSTIKGVTYAVFAAPSGSYVAEYGVDTAAPVISNVAATATQTDATVTWTTNEPASSRVDFGLAPGALSSSASSAGLVQTHGVVLPGLTSGTTYYYQVVSVDAGGLAGLGPVLSFTTILNDDQPTLSIAAASVAEGSGGAMASFAVTLSAPATQTVSASFATTGGTATSGVDFQVVSSTVTLPAGTTSATITVPVSDDLLDEVDETFTVTLSSPIGATLGAAVATGTIVDNDPSPVVSIAAATVTESNATQNATFIVSLSTASGRTVAVSYATSNGTASALADYTASTGTVTFQAGETSQTVVVPVAGDTLDENDETFVVTLSAPVAATLGTAQANGTIVDEDPLPSLAIADVIVAEGNTGNAERCVHGHPLAGQRPLGDGRPTRRPTGQRSRQRLPDASGHADLCAGCDDSDDLVVPVPGDTLDELDETFVVNLSGATNATIADAQAIGTITDNDAAAINIGNVNVTEGNSGTINASFPVTLTRASSLTVTVNYATASDTAGAPDDYTTQTGTVTFAPGVTTQNVLVPIVGDAVNEPVERFFVNLTDAVNATIADAQAIGTIQDNDTVTLSIGDASLTEGNSGTTSLTFTVTRTATVQTVTVNYATANGTATLSPADYSAQSGTLTFSAATATQTITVPIVGDVLDENNETFVVNLSGATIATIADAQGVGTILDDDAPPSLAITDSTVTEGNGGTVNAVFAVSLSAASGRTVTVAYATANATAIAPGDYASRSGTLTFAAGTTTQTISVPIVGDTMDEPDETFVVNLSGATNATISDSQATGTITDNDPTPTLSVNDVSIAEGNNGTRTMTFTVTLSNASSQNVTVNFATANGTASAGSDYTARIGTLTFTPGTTTQTVAITVSGDRSPEANETLFLNLSGVTGTATIADAQGVGTINNND